MDDHNNIRIDLGTDARTEPTEAMWKAMREVELRSVPFRGQATVRKLLDRAAELTGQPSALLLPSCTMANLIAVMIHAGRGDQVVLEESSHIAWSEGWGISSIAGVHPRPVQGDRGRLHLADIEAAIGETRFTHRPRTGLLCLENTHNASGGAVLPPDYTDAVYAAMKERGIPVHLDGSRIFNAAAALGAPMRLLTERFDSVALNLNKSLCVPEGALLCGSEAFVQQASLIAKSLGGGSMHKADLIAAAALVALDEIPGAFSDDHRRARAFASLLQEIPGIRVDLDNVQTNIVMADLAGSGLGAEEAVVRLNRLGVAAYPYRGSMLRFVFHRQIGDADVVTAAERVAQAVAGSGGAER
ncbi:GntG family PLP-dependent aldolase [Paenibacillus sp. MBLB4367]|uniref:GntG family PLP-dependent aldolase n=1 Tax=Paenibacillus sp. MBLB4367 TaxID=3384767 RepID=UPI003907FC49